MVIILLSVPVPLEAKVTETSAHEFNGQDTLAMEKPDVQNLCRKRAGETPEFPKLPQCQKGSSEADLLA